MPIFQYHPSRRDHSEQQAQKVVEARQQRAAAKPAPQPGKPAPRPAAPKIDPNDPSDPWLQDLTARERAARPGTETQPPTPGNEHTKLSPAVYAAVTFLSEALADGQSHPASILLGEAAKQGISKDALHRARKAAHVQTERIKDGWVWSLPDD